jgi:hypothetical protein
MRKLILDRIGEIKRFEQGFSKSTMRWANKSLPVQGVSTPIADIDFREMNDEELVSALEFVIKQYNKQM